MSLPLHYDVQLICKDCGTVFDVIKLDSTVEVITTPEGRRVRGVMMWVPNECSQCHNLKVVKSETEQ